ncbi:MAG: PKD domain-containing protein [Methanomicrobiales archaeon]|nr:PKD domain-containing protein [Methanomicrobiales archaeon]
MHSNPPGIVTFIDQTLVDPIIAGDAPLRYQWEWDFGDGTPPIVTSYFSQNPEHTYDEPGTYLVTQTVRLMDESLENCVRENKFSMYVTISDPLPAIAMFTAAPLTGFAPLTVSFTDLSTGDIATWKWSFGDGTAPMYEQHPVHIYNEPGIYTVTLEVFDADGAALDSISKSHLIHVESPLSLSAQFTAAPRVGLPPLATSFTDLSVDAVEWKWDFGDGTISYEQHPLHTYTDEGTYKVVLQVWDLDGKSAMTTEENFIHVSFAPDPIADFAAIPSSGPVPLVVSFVDQTISHGTIDSYFWDFGNGEFSTQKNPTAVYSTPGSYDVTLTVTDQYGTDSCTKLNVVIAETLQVVFVADPPSGLPSLHVSFIDLSTGAPTLWKWDFGDGHSSNEPNPVNIYTEPGTYEVTLTIFDAHGKTSRDTKTIKVFNPRTQANFVWETPVDLTAEFTDISAGEGINFWEWNFNDGSEFAYEQHPVHTFPSSGEYTVILKISNGISTSTKYRSVRVP